MRERPSKIPRASDRGLRAESVCSLRTLLISAVWTGRAVETGLPVFGFGFGAERTVCRRPKAQSFGRTSGRGSAGLPLRRMKPSHQSPVGTADRREIPNMKKEAPRASGAEFESTRRRRMPAASLEVEIENGARFEEAPKMNSNGRNPNPLLRASASPGRAADIEPMD